MSDAPLGKGPSGTAHAVPGGAPDAPDELAAGPAPRRNVLTSRSTWTRVALVVALTVAALVAGPVAASAAAPAAASVDSPACRVATRRSTASSTPCTPEHRSTCRRMRCTSIPRLPS